MKVYSTAFGSAKEFYICATSAELNLDTLTECGKYLIHEDIGSGKIKVHDLTVDCNGGNPTQTRVCNGSVLYRTYSADGWSSWQSQGGGGSGGVSPSAKVEQTDEGAVITITDASGTTTATVKNGADGKDGADGEDMTEKTVETYTGTLVSNNVYKATTGASMTFPVPTITDSAKHNQALVYLETTAKVDITWAEGFLFVGGKDKVPTIGIGHYRIIFEYNPNAAAWVVGVIQDGEAS